MRERPARERIFASPGIGGQGNFYDDNLGFIIGKVHRQLRRKWQSLLEPTGLTTAQGAILSIVAARSEISQREISRALAIDVMAVRRVLQGLGESGIIDVTTNQADSRKFSYSLTQKGTELAQQVKDLAQKQKHDIERILGPVVVRKLIECLSLLAD